MASVTDLYTCGLLAGYGKLIEHYGNFKLVHNPHTIMVLATLSTASPSPCATLKSIAIEFVALRYAGIDEHFTQSSGL